MANTPNLDLVKPAGTDHALVSVINSNSDKIDAGYGTLSEQIDGKADYVTISSNTDLNDLLSSGIYRSPSTMANVQTLLNCPTEYPFTMVVTGNGSSTGGCTQTIMSNQGIWVRRGTTSGLGAWAKYIQDSDIEPVNITPTLDSNVVDRNGLFVKKAGNVVTVNGYITCKEAVPSSSYAIIGTMPAGSRPGENMRIPCAISNQAYNVPTSVGYASIGTDGEIAAKAPSGNTNKVIYFSASYTAQN